MPEQIIIEGDRARLVRVEELAATRLEHLTPYLTTRLPTTLPVLPRNPARYVHFDPEANRAFFLIETEPRLHNMPVRLRGRSQPTNYRVQLPYQYFAYECTTDLENNRFTNFSIHRSMLFWAPQPVRNPDDKLWPARCPNVDSSGGICWGNTQSDSSSLSAKLDDLVNNFWNTTFNEDLGLNSPLGNLREWQVASQEPLSWMSWPMFEADGTALSELEHYVSRVTPTNIAELNPAYVVLPQLPENFTVARARQWLNGLNDGARRRLLLATTTFDAPEPEIEVSAEPETEEATA